MQSITHLVAAILAALCVACTTIEEERSPYLQHSYGSVVHGEWNEVWAVTQTTLAQVASKVNVDAGKQRVSGQWNQASVSVQVQHKAPMETILRISAQQDGTERPDIAERLQIAIQQALIR